MNPGFIFLSQSTELVNLNLIKVRITIAGHIVIHGLDWICKTWT